MLRTCAHISVSALQHNLRQVKAFSPYSLIMAMVKADAYGHGLLRVAEALADADAFGVATLEEAITLREAGIIKPITVMCGFLDPDELRWMSEQHLTAVIHRFDQISLLQNTPLPFSLSVWLKIDTGMHRLGFLPEQVALAYAQLSESKQVIQPVDLMTHFACSDEPDNAHTLKQIAVFDEIAIGEGARSLASSAAIIAWPQTQADWVRPGIMLYGVSPFTDQSAAAFDLKPVMSLTARLIAIRKIRKGETIGYGATWQCPENMTIGMVSIGYGDGYPRQAKNGTPVLVNGKRCTLVGRVSMDILSIDLSNQPNAAVGDTVLLWGEGLPVEEIAACAGTIGYELLCKVTARVPRLSVA
jgi:alanine racemase